MIIGLFNFEDHCQGKKSQFFSEMCQKGCHSFLTHWSKNIPRSAGADNNSVADNSSTATAIDVLWGRKI